MQALQRHGLCEVDRRRRAVAASPRVAVFQLAVQSGPKSCVTSVRCARDEDDEDKVVFRGWARMAMPIDSFSVVEVRKPNVGEAKPAAVTADIVINPGRERPSPLSRGVRESAAGA